MKSIIIIGGGVTGLTAGIYAQVNGYKSIILEKHHTPGGHCTGWNRQGYHIDGCIHWLVGTKEGSQLRQLWDFVGALKDVPIYHPESFMAFEYEDHTVHFYRDLQRLQSSWIEISPPDKDVILEMCKNIKTLQSFEIPVGKPADLMNPWERLKSILAMKDVGPLYSKYSKISIQDYATRFKHPALRNAIQSFMPEGDYSAIALLFPLGTFTGDQSSIPMGGSLALADRMVKHYKSLGGTIHTSSEVVDVSINKGNVTGLICANGDSHQGDYFIHACDARFLYHNILRDKYNDSKYELRFNNPKLYPLASNIYVALGYAGRMDDIPRCLRFPVEGSSIKQNNQPIEHIQMTHYAYESSFAPEGHTVITVAINQFEPELLAWADLARTPEEYQREKNRIGEEVLAALETRFPEMKSRLTLLDVASPQTYTHFCNAYRGAFMGFWPTLKGKSLMHSGKINGLSNLVLSGQWLQPPGGLPIAVITGRDSIYRLCHKDKKSFRGV